MPVDTRKPEILVILGLVALQALWLLAGMLGIVDVGMDMPWLLIWTAVAFITLYGLYNGQAWSWWLSLFYGIYAILNNISTVVTGDTTAIFRFLLLLLMIALLTKKTVIAEYRPNLTYLEGW